MRMLDCVSFMLIKDGQLLAEKRKASRTVSPGAISIPGGHVEPGEDVVQTLHRELSEELSVETVNAKFVCTLLHQESELRRLHYFSIESWVGKISNNEAEALVWIPLSDREQLDLAVDRTAVTEYDRIRNFLRDG